MSRTAQFLSSSKRRLSLRVSLISRFRWLEHFIRQVSADNLRQDRAISNEIELAMSRGHKPPLRAAIRPSLPTQNVAIGTDITVICATECRRIYRSARSTRARVAADSRYCIPRMRAKGEEGGGSKRWDNHSPWQPRTRPSDMLLREVRDRSIQLASYSSLRDHNHVNSRRFTRCKIIS